MLPVGVGDALAGDALAGDALLRGTSSIYISSASLFFAPSRVLFLEQKFFSSRKKRPRVCASRPTDTTMY